MGYGQFNGKRHLPITSWQGSWAQQQANKTITVVVPKKKLRGGDHMTTQPHKDRKNDYQRQPKHPHKETP